MTSLFHTLGIGAESLYATRQGVDTAGHNIANAQAPGFSRQRVNLKQRDPLMSHNVLIGNGAYVGGITRSHDQFIENQLNRANQEAGRAAASADSMKALEVVFSPELQASIGDEMTTFFSSLQNLSSLPEDFSVRTSVVEAANNLGYAFQRVDSDLKDQRGGLNERIGQTAQKLTDNLKEIAELNAKIQVIEAGDGQSANDLRDRRDLLLRDVSQQIEINYYEDQHGMLLIRGPKQVTLVDRGNAAEVSVLRNNDNDGMYDLVVTDWEQHHTRNITDSINGGSLQAYLDVRDNKITDLLDKNDQLAYAFATNVNQVHRQGYGLKDYSEAIGRDFFRQPDSIEGAASGFCLDDAILVSHDAISSASSPNAPGDNIVLNQMVKLKDMRPMSEGGSTFTEYYANSVGALGLEVVRADHVKEANDILVGDLNSRREAISGVSLDEEATNLMKWQANFTASSKVITTVDEMLDTVLSLKR